MERQYPVAVNDHPAGKVCVTRKGLYYHFSCRCILPGNEICRLTVSCGSKHKNLGVLVPEEGGFCLNTRIPVKEIGEGDMRFSVALHRKEHREHSLQQSTSQPREHFVPICPEEPFAYISRLKESFLTIRDGQQGILINEKQEC